MNNNRKIKRSTYYGFTRSTCSECNKIVDAQILEENNKVYFEKFCPDHGKELVLVSTDIDWYDYCRTYKRKIYEPQKINNKLKRGCPHDCGICSSHKQHSSIIMFGVTNECNLECPICLVTNECNWSMNLKDAKRLIDKIVENEGVLQILSISGGEPTLNPNIIDIIKYANESNIVRCCMSTNGVRIAEDEDFVKELSNLNVLVNLQFDGFRPKTYEVIRGSEQLYDVKKKALSNLKKYNIDTVLIPTIVKGLNEDEIGTIFEYAAKEKFIKSLHIQTLTHTGEGENFIFDPLHHITVTDVLFNIESHYKNSINRYDFVPEPTECFLTGVFLTIPGENPVPLYRFVDMTYYLNIVQDGQQLGLDEIKKLSLEILKGLIFKKRINGGIVRNLKYIKPLVKFSLMILKYRLKYKDNFIKEFNKLMEDSMLLLNFHTLMDKYTFDQKRVMECTHNWITDDETIYPFCTYSLFHYCDVTKKIDSEDQENLDNLQKTRNLKDKYNLGNSTL